MLLAQTKVGRSTIEGQGVFAAEPLCSCSVIWEFHSSVDVRLSVAARDALPENERARIRKYGWVTKRGVVFFSRDNTRYINHCKAANLLWNDVNERITTQRHIPVGEELLLDYHNLDYEFRLRFFGYSGPPGWR